MRAEECGSGARFRLDGVSVSFGTVRALEGIDLTIAPGEAVALVGPSGAGKTTLLSLLNGSVRPSRGEVEVNGKRLSGLAPGELRCLRACIGFIHQDLRLVPNVRVALNVLAGRFGRMSLPAALALLVLPRRRLLREAHALLERVGIPEKLFERTDRLSGGQRQRVAIARALFQKPSALLADEPVASVDPARAWDTVGLLRDLCRERNLTLLVSLHHLKLAREFFPRLVGLKRGRIAFDRAPQDLEREEIRELFRLRQEEMLADAG
jgi:phosphonate transport system ATP-binding protein